MRGDEPIADGATWLLEHEPTSAGTTFPTGPRAARARHREIAGRPARGGPKGGPAKPSIPENVSHTQILCARSSVEERWISNPLVRGSNPFGRAVYRLQSLVRQEPAWLRTGFGPPRGSARIRSSLDELVCQRADGGESLRARQTSRGVADRHVAPRVGVAPRSKASSSRRLT
jgi:hypothetical protein